MDHNTHQLSNAQSSSLCTHNKYMHKLTLISDFNAELLARILSNQDNSEITIDVQVAPFGQVYQSLSAGIQGSGGIVWTLPERIVPSFACAIEFNEVDIQHCLGEVDIFAQALLEFASRSTCVFVSSWCLPSDQRGYGMLDWKPGLGMAHLLARMNLHLAERLSEASNVYLLDAARWSASVGRVSLPKLWYAAKVPYANCVFDKAAADVTAGLLALAGRTRKLILLDLDNTLWGGVIGETGWQGVRLGGHDAIGEAFVDFQRTLKALSRRGIQLAIVSKNDEKVALEAIDLHTEMQLHRSDFAGWRINWDDKAQNIAALVDELNLGLDSAIFIDDNPAERERVRRAFPQVLVPEWPTDPTNYVSALRALDCFDTATVSAEDRSRTAMYVAERDRREIRSSVASPDEWLNQLGTKLSLSRLDKSNIVRVTQLFNKTNQLNLSTRRLAEDEVLEWSHGTGRSLLSVSASDCFGDMGLVGVIGVESVGNKGQLIDFILSCRVMGRRVEQAMVHVAVSELARLGAEQMQAVYLPTPRNRPTLDVFREVGLEETPQHVFSFDCRKAFPKPDFVMIEFNY
jgi:FkbH-like protein